MRSTREIGAEIEALKKMKPNIHRYSGFGDDHYAGIDAQIRVLSGQVSPENFDREFDPRPDNERDDARAALEWMEGESDEAPSEDWKNLLK